MYCLKVVFNTRVFSAGVHQVSFPSQKWRHKDAHEQITKNYYKVPPSLGFEFTMSRGTTIIAGHSTHYTTEVGGVKQMCLAS